MKKLYLEQFERSLAYHFSEFMDYPFAHPYWIFISLSHKCTYKCQMCGVVNILKGYELSKEAACAALEQISRWKRECFVVFTGGEVFLRKDFFEIVDYAIRRKINAEAVSNGSLIDEETAGRVIRSGLKNIAVSLDGATADTHDLVRQKGSFEQALKALRFLVKAKREAGYGPQISVWTTIMKENVSELSAVISLVRDIGVECLVYHPVIVAQDDMQSTCSNAPFWIGPKELNILKAQLNKITSYQKKNGLIAFLHDPYLWLKYFESKLSKKDWKCNPFAFINIGPDGEVRSCGQSFGNIKEIGLNRCLNTSQAYKARKIMKACPKPCLQTCWAYPEADSLTRIVKVFVEKTGKNPAKRKLLRAAYNALTAYEEKLKCLI